MQLATYFGPVAILDLLEFIFEDGGCCCSLVVIVIIIFSLLLNRSTSNNCPDCEHSNQKNAVFCSKCGAAIKILKTPTSFYPNLKLRIKNWKKWGWISESAHKRLKELNEADELVFRGHNPEAHSHKFTQVGNASSQEPVVPPDDKDAAKTDETSSPAVESKSPVEDSVVDQEKTVIKPVDSESPRPEPTKPEIAKPAKALPKPSLPPVKPKASKPLFISSKPTKPPVQTSVSRVLEVAPSSQPIKEAKPVRAVPVPPPKPPRRLSDILRGFMDESNIKLGEFVAGLLIIIGSIGLVTALNIAYKNIPYLSSVVFLTIVSLFHIFGVYSLKKWNLASSSRVVLLIGNLLIPLNVFMTTMGDTSLAEQRIFFILAVVVAGVSFGAMSFYSARLLAPKRPWPLILALMGPCLCQLVIKLVMTGEDFVPTPLNTNGLLLPAIAFISFAILSEHRYFRKSEDVTPDDAFSLLRVLGLGVFSLGACIALMFSRLHTQEQGIELSQYLSNPLMILCFIVVSAGMLIYRRIESDDYLKLQMGGMWMAVTGSMGIIIAMLLAVPDVNSMIIASFVGAVLALIFGYVTRITFLTAAGTLCVGIGIWSVYLSGRYVDDLTFVQLRNEIANGMTSILFTVTAVIAGVLHFFFEKIENRERPEFSKAGYLGVLLLAGVGLASAFASHLPFLTATNSDLTLVVFAVYAIASLVASLFTSMKLVHQIATGLVAVTSLKFVNTDLILDLAWLPEENLLGRLVVFSWMFLGAYVVTLIAQWSLRESRQERLARDGVLHSEFEWQWPLTMTTLAYFVVAILNVFYMYFGQGSYIAVVMQGVLLTGVAVLLGLRHKTDWTWMFVQIQLVFTIAAATTMLQAHAVESFQFWDWEHLRLQMIVLAVEMLGWTAFRKISQQSSHLNGIVVTDLMYMDFFLHALATIAVYIIWVFSLVQPLQGVYPDSAFLDGLNQFYGGLSLEGSAVGSLDWILWGLNLLAWICVLPDRQRRVSSFCGLLTLSALPILASTYLAESAASVNMSLIHYLKWGYGIFGVVVTALVCTDRFWWRALQENYPRLMKNQDEKSEGDHAEYTWMALRMVSFIAASLPVVILTAAHFAYTSSISGIGKELNEIVLLQPTSQSLRMAMVNFAGPFFLLVVAAWICAVRSLRPLYLIAALPMWVLGWMFFSLIPIWADGLDLTFAEGFGSVKWGLIGIGLYGLAWSAAGLKADGRRRQQLFQTSSASNFVYFITACGVCLYALVVNLDALVVIGEIQSAAEWKGWRSAFANPSAFVCVLLLPTVCWMFNRVSQGDRGVSFVLIGTVALNATIAHLAVPDVSLPGTSVLFFQTIGWIVALFACVVGFATCLKLGKFKADSEESHWLAVRRVQGRWVGWVSALAYAIYIAFAIFWSMPNSGSVTYDDGLLLSLMVLVVLLSITMSQLVQNGTTITMSLLLMFPLAVLASLKLVSLTMDLESLSSDLVASVSKILDENSLPLGRMIIAGFAVYVITTSLVQSQCQRWLGFSAHKEQITFTVLRGLMTLCVSLLVIHSIAAVWALPYYPNLGWFEFDMEWGIVLLTLLGLWVTSQESRFDRLIPLLYFFGFSVVATGLVYQFVDLEGSWSLADRQIYQFAFWMMLAGYIAFWGLLYRFNQHSTEVLGKLRIPGANELLRRNHHGIARLQFYLGVIVSVIALLSTFYLKATDDDVGICRYLAAGAPLLFMIGLVSLKETPLAKFREHLTLNLPLVSIVILLWAGISEEEDTMANWYHRLARVYIAFALMATVGYFIYRRASFGKWRTSVEQWFTNITGISVITLTLSLVLELMIYREGYANVKEIVTPFELIGISVGLVCSVLTLAYLGLRPVFVKDLGLLQTGNPFHALASMVLIAILFGHLQLAKPSDSVRFGQVLGWLGLLIVSLSALVNFVRTQVVGKLEGMRQWSSLSSIGGIWIIWVSYLTGLVVAGCLYFLGQDPINAWFSSYALHWCLISLVLLLYVFFSSIHQDALTTGLTSILFTLWSVLTIFMLQGSMDETANVFARMRVISAESYVHIRMLLASFSVLAVLYLLSNRVSRVFTGLPEQEDPLIGRFARWLTNLSVTGLLGVSVVAMLSSVKEGGPRWIGIEFEWAVLLLPLIGLYCCARYVSSERSSTLSIYAYGSTLAATLLTVCFESAESPNTQKFVFFICLTLAIYLALWGAIYRWQDTVVNGLAKIGIRDAGQWMSASRHVIAGLQVSLGLILLACSFLSTFYLSNEAGIENYRYLSALLPLLVVVGLEVLRETPLSSVRRHIVVNAPFVAGIVLLWANLEPGLIDAKHWYQRIGRVFILTSVLAVSFVFRLSNLNKRSEWFEPFRRIRINTTATALITLFVTLVIEAYLRMQGDFDPFDFEVIGIGLGIVAIAATLIVVGLNPELSPIQQRTVRIQQGYVYVAEILLLVLFGHVYLSKPGWFGVLRGYWPFVLLVIAFMGVFISEIFRKRENHVLSEPLHNTAFLLPAIPILTLWLFPSDGGTLFADYSWLFFGAALLNVLMACLRKSFIHSVVAAIAGNASLWLYLTSNGSLIFADDPQLWVIPPAISLMIVAQIFKEKLDRRQISTIRYMCLTLVYLTASFEMVIDWASAEGHTGQMLILGVLSLIGIGVGALFKMSQFIYLGLIFLVMTLLSLVFAALNAIKGDNNLIMIFSLVILLGILILVVIHLWKNHEERIKGWIEKLDSWD